MTRAAAVGGSSVIVGTTSVLTLVYHSLLFNQLGASEALDTYYLCRTIPFYLERTGYLYVSMVLFPSMVASPVSFGRTLGALLRTRAVQALLLVYALLLVAPVLPLRLLPVSFELPGGTDLVARLVVAGSIVLNVNMLGVSWLFARGRYLSGSAASLLNTCAALTVLLALWGELRLLHVAIAYVAGAVTQWLWLLAWSRRASGAGAPDADTDRAASLARRGGGYSVGIALLGAGSQVADRAYSSSLAAGSVSILNVGRQLVESLGVVTFSGLMSSSYTLQCERDKAGLDPEDTAVRDVSAVALVSVLLVVGILFLAEPGLQLVFGHGRFTAAEAHRLYVCVVALGACVGLAPTIVLLSYGYYIRERFRLVFALAVAALAVDLLLKLALLGFGLVGLAVATSLATALHALLLAACLPRRRFAATLSIAARAAVLLACAIPAGGLVQQAAGGEGWLGGLAGAATATAVSVGLGSVLFAATTRQVAGALGRMVRLRFTTGS